MAKKTIIIITIAAAAIIIIAGIFVYIGIQYNKQKNILKDTNGMAEDLVNQATKGTLPSLQTNPLEAKPDLNPVDQANPMKDIKTNPFE